MLYVLASLALPALIGLVVISVYQPGALIQNPWIEYLFWTSLGAGIFKAALELFHALAEPGSSASSPHRSRSRVRAHP